MRERLEMKDATSLLKWIPRFILVYGLFCVFFLIGSWAVAGMIPDNVILEPGLVPMTSGLLIIALAIFIGIGA